MESQCQQTMTRVTINFNLMCGFALHFFNISFPTWQGLDLVRFENPEEGEIP